MNFILLLTLPLVLADDRYIRSAKPLFPEGTKVKTHSCSSKIAKDYNLHWCGGRTGIVTEIQGRSCDPNPIGPDTSCDPYKYIVNMMDLKEDVFNEIELIRAEK